MVSCSEFLREYSEYRDGVMEGSRRAEMRAHLAGCSSCSRYDRVVEDGIGELLGLGEVEPSHDFMPRLQHRIYNVDEEASWRRRRELSGTSLSFVVLLGILIGLAAWLPLMGSRTAVIELPAVAAVAPKPAETNPVHSLFRAGPLLDANPQRVSNTNPASSTVFFRYTPMGGYAGFAGQPSRPR
jgi:predicted anti-sigma-YlaC factor YlaD